MVNLFHIPKGSDFPRTVTAVIEVPSGGRAKYEYDINHGVLRLDRVLTSSARYPGNYGFVPQTLGNFRNPVDVYVLVPEPLQACCVLEVKPLGLLEMADEMGVDSKVIALHVRDPRAVEIEDIFQIKDFALEEIKHFFMTYKMGSNVKGWLGRKEAYDFLEYAHGEYLKRYSNAGNEKR